VNKAASSEKRDRLSLVIFRVVLLIVSRATAAAWVLVLLLGKLAAPSLLTPPIGFIALLIGSVWVATLLAALPLTLGLRHRVFPVLKKHLKQSRISWDVPW
jgi:hypothetical protein